MGPGHSKTLYGIVKLNVLNAVPEGSTVDYESLQAQKLVSKSKYTLKKVVGGPEEYTCLLYTSPSPRDGLLSRMPSSA